MLLTVHVGRVMEVNGCMISGGKCIFGNCQCLKGTLKSLHWMIMEKKRCVRTETWGHLKAAEMRKSRTGHCGEQWGRRGKKTQEMVLSEEVISGREVAPNGTNVANLRICLWIYNDLVTGDSTICEFMGSKPDRNELNEKRGSGGSQ